MISLITEIDLQNLQFEIGQREKRIKKAELKKAELLRKIELLQAGVKEPETTNEEKELLDKALTLSLEAEEVAKKRLVRDFSSLQTTSLVGLSGSPREGDIFTWDCVVCGLPDTMFEMGIFELTLTFTTNYPFQAPSVRFITDIFHPNISPAGILPLDNWTPALDVTELLSNIQRLLSEPDLSSVVNHEAARLYREDRREYARRVDRVIEISLNTEEEENKTIGKI